MEVLQQNGIYIALVIIISFLYVVSSIGVALIGIMSSGFGGISAIADPQSDRFKIVYGAVSLIAGTLTALSHYLMWGVFSILFIPAVVCIMGGVYNWMSVARGYAGKTVLWALIMSALGIILMYLNFWVF